MDQKTLVVPRIDAGAALVDALLSKGFDVTVSGWTRVSEDGDWNLYIATKDVDARGRARSYLSVIEAIESHPELGLDPFEVKLVTADHEIAKDLLAIRGTSTAKLPVRSRRPKLGSLNVDETYVYART